MRYNKKYRDWIELSVIRLGQYFPNFGETISNSDLNTSHYFCC